MPNALNMICNKKYNYLSRQHFCKIQLLVPTYTYKPDVSDMETANIVSVNLVRPLM